MNDYTAADWEPIFAGNGLKSFDDFWQLEAQWFEEPNQRRGGWSGVARCELRLPSGDVKHAFLKRQEDHVTRTLAHPFRGILTFVREFKAIRLYQQLGIPALTPLYFACRTQDGHRRAILITEELAGYRSLDALARDWSSLPRADRRAIGRAVAGLLRQIHDCRLTHNCFYPKHVFLRPAGAGYEARVIDLEKTKRRRFGADHDLRDLRRLVGPNLPWSRSERVRFFREYLGVNRLTPAAKAEWHRVAARYAEKTRRATGSP